MPAKLVVTASDGGSRIALLGSSGKELLTSAVFHEPRAKGATLRALKGLLADVTVEDRTITAPSVARTRVATKPSVKGEGSSRRSRRVAPESARSAVKTAASSTRGGRRAGATGGSTRRAGRKTAKKA